MSYYHAARKAGMCKAFVREEEDYLFDTPHLFSNHTCPAQRTSYDAISHAVRSLESGGADMIPVTPDGWESLWLAFNEAA
jgi:hypothetical protein